MRKYCIVILSYNHPELTARAVESAITFYDKDSIQKESLSILLIHNGSHQKNVQVLVQKFPDIIHLTLSENKGYSGGVNSAIKYAFEQGANWIFLLTNDCQIIDLELPKPTQQPAQIAPLIYKRKISNIDSCGGSFSPDRANIHHLKSASDFQQLINKAKNKPSAYPYVPGSAFWIHKRLIEEIGYFDESLGTYWEDVDFSTRVFLQKLTICANPNNKILHQVGKTNHKNPYYTTFLFQRNRRIICRKYVKKSFLSKIILNSILNLFLFKKFFRHLYKQEFNKIKMIIEILKST